MPYSSARDPPVSQHVVATLVINNGFVEEDSPSSSDSICHALKRRPLGCSRRWRFGSSWQALILMCTVLMSVTTISAFAVQDHHPPTPSEGTESAPDPAAEESGSGWPATGTSDSMFPRHEILQLKTQTNVGDWHIREGGQSQLRQQQQSVDSGPQGRRQRSRHGTGRRFSFSDHRRIGRILVSSACTNKDISIFQSPDGSSGIPRYAVQIMNNCLSDCAPANIHVFCGWFASALLVNPNSFKRIAFNDCIVNGGRPLKHGETLRFTYANSFMYPLRFKSASFCK